MNLILALGVGFGLGVFCAILLVIKKQKLSYVAGLRKARTLANAVVWDACEFEMADAEGNNAARWDRTSAMRQLGALVSEKLAAEIYLEEHGEEPA